MICAGAMPIGSSLNTHRPNKMSGAPITKTRNRPPKDAVQSPDQSRSVPAPNAVRLGQQQETN